MFSVVRRLPKSALACAAACLMAVSATAYNVAPLRLGLEPVGPAATGRIEIRNTETRPITLSVTPSEENVTDKGELVTTPEEEDLLVFPPQLVLQPGQRQAVQVRYVGDPQLAQAKLYSARISQEPIDFKTGQEAQLKMGVDFVTAITVSPKGAKGEVAVDAVRDEPAANRIAVDLRNTGNGAFRLTDLLWSIGGAEPAALTATGFGATTYVPPGGKRTVFLPRASGASPVKDVKATIKSA